MHKYNRNEIYKLTKELYFHPAWHNDKHVFLSLLQKSYFIENDILNFARLYVKYSHLHVNKNNELNKYFKYMIHKMQMSNASNLFKVTKQIYNDKIIKADI